MDKRSKIILGIFLIVLLGIIGTEILRPKPLNWKPSYNATDKIPFGGYVLFQELQELFPGQPVQRVNESLYNFLVDRDTTLTSNYLLINNFLELDRQEANQLLSYVDQGNHAFIAAGSFGTYLSDTLNLKVESLYTLREDALRLQLTNPTFHRTDYSIGRGSYHTHFTSVDTLNTVVLGHISYTGKNEMADTVIQGPKKRPNFIRIKFGKGHFFLNTSPQAFTNYYMLKGNQEYVGNSLSYLKNTTTYWDDYKKAGRLIIDSPMRFVLNQPALRWAYYLTLGGILIFILFRAKREQRIIPVLEPLRNTSVDFARTIGSLYYGHKDYTDLIAKKCNYFMEYLRSHYYIDTQHINDRTASDLAIRSGKSVSETKSLLDLLVALSNKKQHQEQDLIDLDKKIHQFKK
ncbi:MAG TPA: DUF4350 domain-containing protein [Arenibacter sp.]|nr:DUF4350 domain-containing protein [Arenibacter sp.]